MRRRIMSTTKIGYFIYALLVFMLFTINAHATLIIKNSSNIDIAKVQVLISFADNKLTDFAEKISPNATMTISDTEMKCTPNQGYTAFIFGADGDYACQASTLKCGDTKTLEFTTDKRCIVQ